MGAQIFDIGGTTAFWEPLDRRVHPLSITLINLPGLVDLQQSEVGIQVLNGNLASLKTLIADRATDRAIDVVVCRGVLEHIEDQQQQRSLSKLLRNAGLGYWVQTAPKPTLLHRLWSSSSDLAWEETEGTKPSWIDSHSGAAILDRQGLAMLFPDATRIVPMRQLWHDTSYAAYRACEESAHPRTLKLA
jgi:hypothetical protein